MIGSNRLFRLCGVFIFYSVLVWLVYAMALIGGQGLLSLWWVGLLGLILTVILDGWLASRSTLPHVSRDVPRYMLTNHPATIALTMHWPKSQGSFATDWQVSDAPTPLMTLDHSSLPKLPMTASHWSHNQQELSRRQAKSWDYEYTPEEFGPFTWHRSFVYVSGPLKLVQRRFRMPLFSQSFVLPSPSHPMLKQVLGVLEMPNKDAGQPTGWMLFAGRCGQSTQSGYALSTALSYHWLNTLESVEFMGWKNQVTQSLGTSKQWRDWAGLWEAAWHYQETEIPLTPWHLLSGHSNRRLPQCTLVLLLSTEDILDPLWMSALQNVQVHSRCVVFHLQSDAMAAGVKPSPSKGATKNQISHYREAVVYAENSALRQQLQIQKLAWQQLGLHWYDLTDSCDAHNGCHDTSYNLKM